MSERTGFELVDTSLRNEKETENDLLHVDEKLDMAVALDRAGVGWIEAGTPAMGQKEQEILKLLLALPLKAKLIAWNRAEVEDIRSSLACGFSYIHVSIPVSDWYVTYRLQKSRDWVIGTLKEVLQLGRSSGCSMIVGAEDASRADPEFFLHFADVAAQYGAMRIRFADTMSCMDPFKTFSCLQELVKRCPLPIEFHGHDALNLATANTLAAFQAGVSFASVTLNGRGRKSANAPLQETAASLEKFYNYRCGVKLQNFEMFKIPSAQLS